jgi:hypothetical protein
MAEKASLIKENIVQLIDGSSRQCDHTVFDQMNHFLTKLASEEKTAQIKDAFVPVLNHRIKAFDKDIFNEIQHFVLLFGDLFTVSREIRHLSRLISFKYLFRKKLLKEIQNSPHERHFILKMLKTQFLDVEKHHCVVGFLIGMNVLSENEIFEERHIVEAIQHCMPTLRKVQDSYIVDRRSCDNIRLFYLEFEKENSLPLTLPELKQLRKRLPRELKSGIENVIHPVFMPRNEEEVMRNILSLSQQLKYVNDIPQVVISFEAQTEKELSFSVILLRIVKDQERSITEIFHQAQPNFLFYDYECKHVGYIRKKYVKEANVFKVKLEKRSFLRKNYSLDLFKARQMIYTELVKALGEVRDFNGGILSKQNEVFHALKQELAGVSQTQDFLLENFFYSITPSLMQSLLPLSVLKTLFLMLFEIIENDSIQHNMFLKSKQQDGYFLVVAGGPCHLFKDVGLVQHLPFAPSDLAYAHVNVYEISCVGYLFQCEDRRQAHPFLHSLGEHLRGQKISIQET